MRPNNNKCSESFDERLHRHLVTATDGEWICLTLTSSQSFNQIHVSKEPYIRWGSRSPTGRGTFKGDGNAAFCQITLDTRYIIIIKLYPLHAVHKMQPISTDVARSMVCVSVCLKTYCENGCNS